MAGVYNQTIIRKKAFLQGVDGAILRIMIQNERLFVLKKGECNEKGAYVLYWMQQSQRSGYNHALEYALGEANRRSLPLLVLFVVSRDYLGAGRRHYRFLLEGIEQLEVDLADRGIGFLLRIGDPPVIVAEFAADAALVVFDTGYTRLQRSWRKAAAAASFCAPVMEVESDLVVPVRTASGKEEYSAATIRRKITPLLFRFMQPLKRQSAKIDSTALAGMADGLDSKAVEGLLRFSQPEVSPVSWIHGGSVEAHRRLDAFITSGTLERFHEERNDPSKEGLSCMSPYLHYGQISALEIALRASEHPGPGCEAFLEELIIRRELAFNFVFYNRFYDSFEALPRWAREDLEAHEEDQREVLYDDAQLEVAKTHDPYWNAAQRELVHKGKMHGYMRMYWGKKILEWSASPKEAFERALRLNDRYSLDGRDPNGYTGIAWCFGKHDRPWASRPIFGKIRYMNDRGLERKFDIASYVKQVQKSCE